MFTYDKGNQVNIDKISVNSHPYTIRVFVKFAKFSGQKS